MTLHSPDKKKDIVSRKKKHLAICLKNHVESNNTHLSDIHFVHKALPKIDFGKIDTSISFLNTRISYPIFISCMTGGTRSAYNYNARFAEVANTFNIPIGLGSIRVLLKKESLLPEFQLKKIAPKVPLIANLGAAQLQYIKTNELQDVLTELKADALALHLNPAQELHQQHGQRNFEKIFTYIKEYITSSSIPVIIKETGSGIHPQEVQQLLSIGAKYVDIAGSGGTNWPLIELYRNHSIKHSPHLFESFSHWGNTTGLLLLALYGTPSLIASGGIRTAHDVTSCLTLGATIVGLALPILQNAGSTKKLSAFLTGLTLQIKIIMALCEAHTVTDMKNARFWLEPRLQKKLHAFCKACDIEVHSKFK